MIAALPPAKTASVALIALFGIAGCSSTADLSKEPPRISVSAANYSQVSGEELYRRINAPDNPHPAAPPAAQPPKPYFYAFVPIDYTPEVPLETIFRELATPLAQRGYFNIIYQIKAGYVPNRIDYLLRIYCGRRYWLTPTVRTDKVTWGNDGLVNSSRGTANMIGASSMWDPHAGTTPAEIASVAMNFQQGPGGMGGVQGNMGMGEGMGNMVGGRSAFSPQHGADYQDLSAASEARFYWLIMIDAFRYADVRDRKNAAPCVWSTLAAMPYRQGMDSVQAIRMVTRAAMPYFGATTDGLQFFGVPQKTP